MWAVLGVRGFKEGDERREGGKRGKGWVGLVGSLGWSNVLYDFAELW